jgi:putative transposase
VHGTKDAIEKPRVRNRSKGKELGLETYASLNKQDSLNKKFLTSILSGKSTRNYPKTVEAEFRKMGVSKSSVSRDAIVATKPLVEAFLKRNLAPLNFVALFIDGIHLGTKQVLVCIGVGAGGKKYVLGLKPGATENEIVCRDLRRDLKERGLKVDRRYLFVVDGAKALAAAIHAAFGNDTAIQRCIEHKIRDIEAYLPFKERASIRGKLRAAWNQKTEKAAQKRLSEIRFKLIRISEAAANSLTEGMLDMLTLHRLGNTGELRESLRTTNVIESAFSAARRLTAKTTRYRDEQAVIMWLARGLQEAEKNFRPVRGYQQHTSLSSKLNPAKE